MNRGKQIKIVTSTFGTLAGLRGASSIVFEKFFNGEINWNSLVRNSIEENEE